MFLRLQIIGVSGILAIFFLLFHTSPSPTPALPQIQGAAVATALLSEPPLSQSLDTSSSTALGEKNHESQEKITHSSYDYEPLSPLSLRQISEISLVNILCSTSNNRISPISGSGVIIDPRGVILTNAHVAQYLLLDSRPEIDLDCVIRTGSPAETRWRASILYFPQSWMEEHAADITNSRPLGTGEHDYAFLLITESVNGEPLPTAFPFVSPDTRERIVRVGDVVFLAAYPSEFSGNSATREFLPAATTLGTVRQLLTLEEDTADLYSLTPTIVAQSGSSGGSVINPWGWLVGIISTTSDGNVLAQRDLRALSVAYINRDLKKTLGIDLYELLLQDVHAEALVFAEKHIPPLAEKLVNELER